MRELLLTISLVLGGSFIASAQDWEVNMYESVDLYHGMDQEFYSGTNLGTKNPIYSAYPVIQNIRFNRVDGLFLGFQEEKMDWSGSEFLGIKNLDIHGLAGYSVAQAEFQYALGAEKRIGIDRKWLMIGGEFHRSTSTEDYWRSGLFENSFTAITMGYDYHDYFKTEGFGFYTLLRPFKFVELGASYNAETYSSLETETDFAVFSRLTSFRTNPAIDALTDQINQQSIHLGLTLTPAKLQSGSSFWTTFSAKAELADIGGTSNDFKYNRYWAEMKSFLRLDKTTLLKWRLMSGSITGDSPDFKNFALGGIGTLRALGYKALNGNQMVLSNLEIELGKKKDENNGGALLNSLYMTFFFDSGLSEFNNNLYSTKNPIADYSISFSDLSHSAGVGIGMRMIRFEVAQPISGAEGQTFFWVRFNPTF